MHFVWAGLLNSVQTGAPVPSQRFLINKMIAPVPAAYRGRIIELGPGNGALTLRLAARCPKAQILACEINPVLARDARKNLNRAGLGERVKVVPDSAENMLAEISRKEVKPADFIISGIPLANLGREQTLTLIDAVHRTLRKGGMYIQFQYSFLDRKKIKARFAKLRTVPAFLNFPPALVYYAWK
jgi:phospholipid N-methyltransferase